MTARTFHSIGTKLAVPTIVLVGCLAAAVYTGLSRQERENALNAKEHAASMASGLFLRSVATPVMFDDPQGTSDAMALLLKESEVLGVELWKVVDGGAGDQLASRFAVGHASMGKGIPVGVQRLGDRLVIRDVVKDGDGKVLALAAVQFSLARENAHIAALERKTLAFALAVAVALASLVIFSTRRMVVRPIGRLLLDIKRVEDGDAVDISRPAANDEVGRLADAFGRMADAVSARERDIAQRNHDMKLVLENVDQGFLVVDLQGTVGAQRSSIVDRWLGPPPSTSLVDWLRHMDAQWSSMVAIGLDGLRDGFLPIEVSVDQLPRKLEVNAAGQKRELSCTWQPIIAGDVVQQLVLVMSDVTAERQRERAERVMRDVMAAVSSVARDRSGFVDFVTQTQLLVEAVLKDDGDRVLLMRNLHTLKGNCGIFGIHGLARLCHELEDGVVDGAELSASARDGFKAAFRDVLGQVEPFLGTRDAIILERREYWALLEGFDRGVSPAELRSTLEALGQDPMDHRLRTLGERALTLSKRLGKAEAIVNVDADGVRIPYQWASELWAVMPHVIRNAVDHGFRAPEEAVGTSQEAVTRNILSLSASITNGALHLAISDNGHGIDWERLRHKAEGASLPHATQADLVAALFADGLTTSNEASETSGRGMGMAAVRDTVSAMGGSIDVSSVAEQGTRFTFTLPLPRPATQRAA